MGETITTKMPFFILNDLNSLFEDYSNQQKGIIYTETVKFSNGYEAEIKLVGCEGDCHNSGLPVYVDAVLFDEDGSEIAIIEPTADTFDGEYIFLVDGDNFIVKIECDEKAEASERVKYRHAARRQGLVVPSNGEVKINPHGAWVTCEVYILKEEIE